jgi:3-phosphoshikimate 1-carboxyvinyltransferase
MDMPPEPFEVPSGRAARGRVTAPPSKSHAIRALVCAALADGTSTLEGLSRCDADDVKRTVAALKTFGFAVERDRVRGEGGKIPKPNVTLDLGGSATAFRFLTAVAALGPGPTKLTGDGTLLRRPMDAIVAPLRALGVTVTGDERGGHVLPPLVVAGGPPSGDALPSIDTSDTSQALSALMLIAPGLRNPKWPKACADVALLSDAVSRPYITMTDQVVTAFGMWTTAPRVAVRYVGRDLQIEGDWSSAAYALAAAAVTGGDVHVDGLAWESAQADRAIARLLSEFGAAVRSEEGGVHAIGGDRRPLDADLKDAPDLAPLVGALGCVATGTTRVGGAAHLRLKESDRIATVVAAARALGCEARERPDGFEIDGPAKRGGRIETKHDHRVAMAFAVAGLAVPGVVIDRPRCVAKSWPGFWSALRALSGLRQL